MFDNATKLYFETVSEEGGGGGDQYKYKFIYDISDENNVTRISKERI